MAAKVGVGLHVLLQGRQSLSKTFVKPLTLVFQFFLVWKSATEIISAHLIGDSS